MPLTTSICFFRHAACAHQMPQREFAKAAVCLYQMFYPQRRCQRQSVYCTYLFFLHVFQTKFKRKKHLPPQVLQQKGIFHSKKFVFYSILFSCTLFNPNLSVKNIHHHKFCNKKAFSLKKICFLLYFVMFYSYNLIKFITIG